MKSLLYHLIRTWTFPLPSKNFWQLITMVAGVGAGRGKEKDLLPSHLLKIPSFEGVSGEHRDHVGVEDKERCPPPCNSPCGPFFPNSPSLGLMTSAFHPCSDKAFLPILVEKEGHWLEGEWVPNSRLHQLHDHGQVTPSPGLTSLSCKMMV